METTHWLALVSLIGFGANLKEPRLRWGLCLQHLLVVLAVVLRPHDLGLATALFLWLSWLPGAYSWLLTVAPRRRWLAELAPVVQWGPFGQKTRLTALTNQGDLEAGRRLAEAQGFRPDTFEHLEAFRTCVKGRQFAEAVAEYETLCRSGLPDLQDLRLTAAWCYARLGRHEDAVECLALCRTPHLSLAAVRRGAGRFFIVAGDLPRGEAWFVRAGLFRLQARGLAWSRVPPEAAPEEREQRLRAADEAFAQALEAAEEDREVAAILVSDREAAGTVAGASPALCQRAETTFRSFAMYAALRRGRPGRWGWLLIGLNLLGYAHGQAGAVTWAQVQDGQVWRLLAYQFTHLNGRHLAANLVGLTLFAGTAETFFGPAFVLLYLGCGALAGAVQTSLTPVSLLGASGAVLALMGLEMGLLARTSPLLWEQKSQALRWLLLASVLQVGADQMLPQVGWIAHLVGLLAGLALGLVWPYRRPYP